MNLQDEIHHMTEDRDNLKRQLDEQNENLSNISENVIVELNNDKAALVARVEELTFQIDELKAQHVQMEGVYQTELEEAGEVKTEHFKQ